MKVVLMTICHVVFVVAIVVLATMLFSAICWLGQAVMSMFGVGGLVFGSIALAATIFNVSKNV